VFYIVYILINVTILTICLIEFQKLAANRSLLHSVFFILILTSEVFPAAWKTATVIPNHKTGSQTVILSYRPKALLPSFSKVFANLMHKHIYSYLDYHKLLIPNNSGFWKKNLP